MSWRILTRLGAMVAVALAVVGCDSIQGNQSPVFAAATENAAAQKPDTDNAIKTYFGFKTEAERRDFRDEIITRRMNAINTNYRVFATELREARAGTGLAADGTITLLGFLTAVIGGASTKAALGAGTAAIAGSKGAFDKNVFYEQALAAVISQMDAQRARISADIRTGMKVTTSDYPLIAELDDLGRLERAGSIETAIAGLTESAKKDATEAEKIAAKVTTTFTPAQTQLAVTTIEPKIALRADALKLPDATIVEIVNAAHPILTPRNEQTAKEIEEYNGKKRTDKDVAKLILSAWLVDPAMTAEALAYWQDLIKSKKKA